MSQRESIVSLAIGEIGHAEPTGDDKYIKWYSTSIPLTTAWCAIFVSWCANKAGVSTSVIPKFASCTIGMNWFKGKGRWRNKSGYTPQSGDIIFFTNKKGVSTHVGIVEKVIGNTVHTIEGNANDKVMRRTYEKSNSYILGYGVPNYPIVKEEYDISLKHLQQILNAVFRCRINAIGTRYGALTKKYCRKLKIQNGTKGEYVKWVQAKLKKLGFYDGPVCSASGPLTMNAVYAFQRKYRLGVGYFGGKDWDMIVKL